MKRLLFLIPVFIHRLTGWLPFQPKPSEVQFANVGEGVYSDGIKSYRVDASGFTTPGAHFLLYKKSASAPTLTGAQGAAAGEIAPGSVLLPEYVTVTTAAKDVPLGPSDDAAERVGDLINVNLLGAVRGTLRVITDGTIADGDWVMPSATALTSIMGVTVSSIGGAVGKWTSGNGTLIGKAIIGSDSTSASGDVITIIPCLAFATTLTQT